MGQSSIFTTGVQKILEQVAEIEIVGVVPLTPLTLAREQDKDIEALSAEVVVLAGEEDDPATVEMLLPRLLKRHPDLMVIVTNLAEDMLHIYTSHPGVGRCPEIVHQCRVARAPDLIAAICNIGES